MDKNQEIVAKLRADLPQFEQVKPLHAMEAKRQEALAQQSAKGRPSMTPDKNLEQEFLKTNNPQTAPRVFYPSSMGSTMGRPNDIPDEAKSIRTYAEFRRYLQAFADGKYQLLILVARPGLAKSRLIRDALKGKKVYVVDGYARPVQLYISLYHHRHRLVVLDDAQGPCESSQGRNLLTHLCNTDPVKELQWYSSSRILDEEGVPRRFTTSSHVCIITNSWHGSAKEIRALEDRGHLIYFDPSPGEVHAYAADWFWDQEIFSHVGKNLALLDQPTCRMYIKAAEEKEAGGDWQEIIDHHFFKDKMLMVKAILESPHLAKEQMVEQAKKDAGISRATFFRWQKKLNEANGNANYAALSNLQVKGTKPQPVKIEELPCDAQDLTHEPEPRLASMKQKKTLQADNGRGDVSCLRLVPFPSEEARKQTSTNLAEPHLRAGLKSNGENNQTP